MHPVPTLSPLFTSVSSCTSSIVGHGSAICARGIFAGFSVSPSAAQVRILVTPGSSEPLLSSAVPRSSSLRSRVQSQEISQHFALYRAERTHIRSLQSRALQTNVIPVIWLRRRWVTRAYLLKVIILVETAQTHTPSKRVLSGKRVGLLGILVWQAGEKSAESNTDPSSFNEAVRESNAT